MKKKSTSFQRNKKQTKILKMIDENCIFCKIVQKKIPANIIYEDAEILALMDAFPSVAGQVLVIPKDHIAPYLFDANDNIYIKLMLASKKIAKAMDHAIGHIKTGLVVEGLEVEHVHIKLYPLMGDGFKCLSKPTPKIASEEMKKLTESIKSSL
jgi:histidine triad (HIT) family protein